MAEPEWVPRDRIVQFLTSGAAPLFEQSLVTAEGLEPVTRRGARRAGAQIQQHLRQIAGPRDLQAGRSRGRFEEMEMRIDKARGDRAPAKFDQMSARPD